MIKEETKFNLKIFQIDKSYYEFKDKTPFEIIEIIKTNHEKKLRHNSDDFALVKPEITYHEEDEFKFWSYCFNQPKEKFYWKLFLPDNLTENQNFEVVEFSFVLFINYKSSIYCVISGSGMNVIKKFIDPYFGIDIYQKIASPTEDVVIDLETRGIANNISQKKQIFSYNQTIAETLEYSEVPTKIKLKIRDELKKNELKKYSSKDLSLLEVGSYFFIRKKLNFNELKELIVDIHEIKNEKESVQLTLFLKINNIELVSNLENALQELIVTDIFLHSTPEEIKSYQSDVIEVVHPSKLERFYECDSFVIRAKYSKGKKDVEINDRSLLYNECTKHIYNNLEKHLDRFEAKQKLYTLNIVGRIDGAEKTYGNFFSHIIAEMDYLNKKYFKIDGHWYLLEDNFLDLMNKDAVEYYNKYKLKEDILLPWPENKDEDFYNKSHNVFDNHYVLDKVLNDNIELCDLLVFENGKVYFIHVKNGFNTKMRDLYVQVVLSAKRLSNDLKNINGSSYLKKTIQKYNSENPTKKIKSNELIESLRKDPTQINFVMAFNNKHYKGKPILERIEKCKSNIAKYALIQVIKEMQQYSFGINLIDISDL